MVSPVCFKTKLYSSLFSVLLFIKKDNLLETLAYVFLQRMAKMQVTVMLQRTMLSTQLSTLGILVQR